MRSRSRGRLSEVAKDPPKLPPLESEGSSSLLSAPRSRLDLSLEAIFDEMGTAQQGINSAVRQINGKVDKLAIESAFNRKDLLEIKKWVGQTLLASTAVADRVRDLTLAIERNSSIVVDKKNADLAIGERLGDKIDEIRKDITGSHALQAPEDLDGEAPHILRVIVVRLTNLGWKNKAKVAGWVLIAGTSIVHAWQQIAPWLHGLFR